MKNVAVINVCDYGSTGKIASGLHNYLKKSGYSSIFCYGRGAAPNDMSLYKIDNQFEIKLYSLISRICGDHGCHADIPTQRMLSKFDDIKIDGIFLINPHVDYINEDLLFKYIIDKNIPLVYVMIDEYPFLGKCVYNSGCERYKIGCGKCPQVKEYPHSWFFDRSAKKYKLKEKAYKKLERVVFTAPEFVRNKAISSPLLYNKRIEIADEAIDVLRCKPRDNNKIRVRLGIEENKIIICSVVPFNGSKNRKGGHYYLELAKRFENDDRYVFIHVGYTANTSLCPSNYLPIGFVANQEELPDYYSVADLFVFPSLDDTMPNTCLEALACGTPLLCFDISGMPYLADSSCATFVEAGSVDQLVEVVKNTTKKSVSTINVSRNYALSRYDSRLYYEKLINLMKDL